MMMMIENLLRICCEVMRNLGTHAYAYTTIYIIIFMIDTVHHQGF